MHFNSEISDFWFRCRINDIDGSQKLPITSIHQILISSISWIYRGASASVEALFGHTGGIHLGWICMNLRVFKINWAECCNDMIRCFTAKYFNVLHIWIFWFTRHTNVHLIVFAHAAITINQCMHLFKMIKWMHKKSSNSTLIDFAIP